MRIVLTALSMMVLGLAPLKPAAADVVVELYTSQGCSSCPPADLLLGELAKTDGIVALSLHVDYWDYLGWKDKFSNPAFTKRQRRYAAEAGSAMIYTPQMVIGGMDHIVGTKEKELRAHLARHAKLPKPVSLETSRNGGVVVIRADSKIQGPRPMVVQLVQYSPSETVDIKRGENAGRKITYHNVVMGWTKVADWDGAAPLSFQAEAQPDLPAVVIIQEGAAGAIVAAEKVD